MPLTSITRIISGGQTGVDRAALDAAMELGLSCGGWCPKGRRAEDGVIPSRYPLQETPTADYAQRTHWNVRDSDGTVILILGKPITPITPHPTPGVISPLTHPLNLQARLVAPSSHGPSGPRPGPFPFDAPIPGSGTAFTIDVTTRLNKPLLIQDLAGHPTPSAVQAWAEAHRIHVLNVAGPRESAFPGISNRARQFLLTLLA